MSRTLLIVLLVMVVVVAVALVLIARQPAPLPANPTGEALTAFWSQPGAASTATAIGGTMQAQLNALQNSPTATPG